MVHVLRLGAPVSFMLLQIRFPSCLFPALQPNPPSSNSSHPAFYTFPATLLSPLSSACPPSLLRHVSHPAPASPTAEGSPYLSSAAAVAGAIRRSSPESPVEFTQRVDRPGKTGVVLPSSDFQRLCVEQLDLFRAVVDPHAILSTQMHTLTPFGADLSSGRMEDKMAWNFVAGLAVAREILETYGCVIRVISPRKPDTVLGAGGTRIELWLLDINSGLDESFLVEEQMSDHNLDEFSKLFGPHKCRFHS